MGIDTLSGSNQKVDQLLVPITLIRNIDNYTGYSIPADSTLQPSEYGDG
jgi:hypothetical protein